MSGWTIGMALKEGKRKLREAYDEVSFDAQILLATVLGVDRAHIIAHPEKPISDEQVVAYANLIQRRVNGEPYAYLVGHREFYGRDFIVTPDVLVPRPETEHLVEHAIMMVEGFYKDPAEVRAVDVGTGSGIIAISFALRFPTATVYATDISPEALAVAKRNAELHGVKNIQFLEGHLLEPLYENNIKVDLILCNPPYLPSDLVPQLPFSRFEPEIALDGGTDGLLYYHLLFKQVHLVGIPPIRMFLEIGSTQSQAVLRIAHQHLSIMLQEVIRDYAGHDRVVRLSAK
jgi:release factor glutamine methyltransferase